MSVDGVNVHAGTCTRLKSTFLPWEKNLCECGLVNPTSYKPMAVATRQCFSWGFIDQLGADTLDKYKYGENAFNGKKSPGHSGPVTGCRSSNHTQRAFKLLLGSGLLLGGIGLLITSIFVSSTIIWISGWALFGLGVGYLAILAYRNQTTGRGLPFCHARIGDLVTPAVMGIHATTKEFRDSHKGWVIRVGPIRVGL